MGKIQQHTGTLVHALGVHMAKYENLKDALYHANFRMVRIPRGQVPYLKTVSQGFLIFEQMLRNMTPPEDQFLTMGELNRTPESKLLITNTLEEFIQIVSGCMIDPNISLQLKERLLWWDIPGKLIQHSRHHTENETLRQLEYIREAAGVNRYVNLNYHWDMFGLYAEYIAYQKHYNQIIEKYVEENVEHVDVNQVRGWMAHIIDTLSRHALIQGINRDRIHNRCSGYHRYHFIREQLDSALIVEGSPKECIKFLNDTSFFCKDLQTAPERFDVCAELLFHQLNKRPLSDFIHKSGTPFGLVHYVDFRRFHGNKYMVLYDGKYSWMSNLFQVAEFISRVSESSLMEICYPDTNVYMKMITEQSKSSS